MAESTRISAPVEIPQNTLDEPVTTTIVSSLNPLLLPFQSVLILVLQGFVGCAYLVLVLQGVNPYCDRLCVLNIPLTLVSCEM
jgi:hypothetical protein